MIRRSLYVAAFPVGFAAFTLWLTMMMRRVTKSLGWDSKRSGSSFGDWLYEKWRARVYERGPGSPKKGWYHTWNR